jgi:hypothetical protein
LYPPLACYSCYSCMGMTIIVRMYACPTVELLVQLELDAVHSNVWLGFISKIRKSHWSTLNSNMKK